MPRFQRGDKEDTDLAGHEKVAPEPYENRREQENLQAMSESHNALKSDDLQWGQAFWNSHWENDDTGWDIGYASPPITTYLAQYPDKQAAVLIPGCGHAYEAEFLVQDGFTNITLLDIAPRAVARLKNKFAGNPQVTVLCEDFFTHVGIYDLMVEQTFFCAIPPANRQAYVKKAASLLPKNGKLIGLLFNKHFEKAGPPFGGCVEEYKRLFAPYFTIRTMAESYNSIPPRAGAELFVHLMKR